jgi:hypothetical protein
LAWKKPIGRRDVTLVATVSQYRARGYLESYALGVENERQRPPIKFLAGAGYFFLAMISPEARPVNVSPSNHSKVAMLRAADLHFGRNFDNVDMCNL